MAVSKFAFKPYLSILTVPLKVRYALDTFPQSAQIGLTNIGVSANLFNYRLDRYFSTGNKASHLFSLGVLLAPSVEELNPGNTDKNVNKTSKQLFMSTGLTVTYTYNDVTFALVPLGFEIATTNDEKHYIYNKKMWWGAGLGISTKLLGFF